MLESVIRKTVTGMVAEGHPEFARSSSTPSAAPEPAEADDFGLHPERDPALMALPGAANALAYRERIDAALADANPRAIRELTIALHESGIPIHTLSVMLFSPIAKHLGDRWCTDDVDFIQVAVASTRLSMMIKHLMQAAPIWADTRNERRCVLLARANGAQHTLGILIVAACFRDLGWHVDGGSDLEIGDSLLDRLAASTYNLLGMSVGSLDDARPCSDAITEIRARHKSPKLWIAVGGPAVVCNRRAFEGIGADIVASTAMEAVRTADRLVH
ncbi:B12-binding domain-containing protein [Zhengella sp. ZM62]|uniref:cobalamin B12-binding domain-containing protein n=1 Tax=Zhengella sedimenti TaxID=3390035 RepID=UPI0039754369